MALQGWLLLLPLVLPALSLHKLRLRGRRSRRHGRGRQPRGMRCRPADDDLSGRSRWPAGQVLSWHVFRP